MGAAGNKKPKGMHKKHAFRLFMFTKAETYVFLVGNVSFGFGKHTFPVGETYNRQAYNFVDALELWILAF